MKGLTTEELNILLDKCEDRGVGSVEELIADMTTKGTNVILGAFDELVTDVEQVPDILKADVSVAVTLMAVEGVKHGLLTPVSTMVCAALAYAYLLGRKDERFELLQEALE